MPTKTSFVSMISVASVFWLALSGCHKEESHNDRSDEVNALQQKLESSNNAKAVAEAKQAEDEKAAADARAKAAGAEKSRADSEKAAADAAKAAADAEKAAADAKAAEATATAERNRTAALSAATENGRALDDANKRITALMRDLKAATAESSALSAASRVDTTTNLGVFSGLWVADGDESMGLQEGCRIFYRVDTKPAQVLRFIGCMNGTLEISVAPVAKLTTEPSRFPGGFQLSAIIGVPKASCGYANTSVFPAQTALAFDLKTASGGAAAIYSYTMLGEQEIALHAGAAVDDFANTSDCGQIQELAKEAADTPANYTLRLAAKACSAQLRDGGCYVTNGYVAPASN